MVEKDKELQLLLDDMNKVPVKDLQDSSADALFSEEEGDK